MCVCVCVRERECRSVCVCVRERECRSVCVSEHVSEAERRDAQLNITLCVCVSVCV